MGINSDGTPHDLYSTVDTIPLWNTNGYAMPLMQYGSKYRDLRCGATACTGCPSNKRVYHSCPGCGKDLARDSAATSIICGCGTWISMCRWDRSSPTSVEQYVIPSQLYKDTITKDDSI